MTTSSRFKQPTERPVNKSLDVCEHGFEVEVGCVQCRRWPADFE